MTDKERYSKYIEEQCKNCKNKNTELCNIEIQVQEDCICTKCSNYESVVKRKRKKAIHFWQTW